MKQIDKLLLKSFIGPFFVAFGVALFVLIMQFLWLYIDEIAGKGVSIFTHWLPVHFHLPDGVTHWGAHCVGNGNG
jgi:lipopolysaccharide export LptBFGC system permease protein LptF